MKLDLNEQEKNALIDLINIAVKASGLQVAEAGVVLAKKISQEEEPKEKPEEKPQKEEKTPKK